MRTIGFCMFLIAMIHLQLIASPAKFELKTSDATLSIDPKGSMKIVQGKGENLRIEGSVFNLWKVVLKNTETRKEFTFTPGKELKLDQQDGVYRMTVSSFTAEGQVIPAVAEFTISVKADGFCFSGSIKTETPGWIIKEVNYPLMGGIRITGIETGIYWPVGLGEYHNNPELFGSRSLWYPAAKGCAMPWFSLNYPGGGLYVGDHDVTQENKVINLSYDKVTGTFSTGIDRPVYEATFQIPEVMIKPYTGEWYKAAKYYKTWYNKHFVQHSPPAWVKDDTGWLLAILKQQNMEVMWNYRDIDKLCDVADRFNLTTIGLFGWAVGGHDHLYPYYNPDNLMGGRKELMKAIERAHQRGKKIILYANGKIMDTSTDFYLYNGSEAMVKMENRQPEIQYYIKQKNATPVIFAQGCTGSPIWRKTMFDLGLQAVNLGADGILYDQMGVMTPQLCFSEDHDHIPGMSDTHNRNDMIREIRTAMRKINPGFIVMTEATNDAIIKEIDYHHGWGVGLAPGPNVFPELFRYTFPELISTQRNPNPMITRTDANFAAVMGLRHEVETRYAGDVAYLLQGKLPKPEDYSNVVSPPNLNKMNLLPAVEAEKYVHTLIGFENENAAFFRHGKFIAKDGIIVKGNDISANGFLNDNKIGVVVWNTHPGERKDFSVEVPGYHFLTAAEPGRRDVPEKSALDADSIRLLVFERD